MFVYQNIDRDICVTFKSNRPVAEPEYVISIDHEANTITVNGQLMEAVSTETAEPDAEAIQDPEIPTSQAEPETEEETGLETE